MKKEIEEILLSFSVVSFALVAVFLTLMFFGNNSADGLSAIAMVSASGFYFFLLSGIVSQVILSAKLKKWYVSNNIEKVIKKGKKIGLVSFFKNLPAAVSDIAFVVGVIVFVIAYYNSYGTSIICFISLSIIFLSFCAHCIFNGKNYYYIKNKAVLEKKVKTVTEESK